MDEKKQPSEQDILAEIAGPLEALAKLGRKGAEGAEAAAEAAETAAAETAEAAAETVETTAAETAEAAVETAETAAAETAEAAAETVETAAAETAEAAVETAETAAAETAEAVAETVETAAAEAVEAPTEVLSQPVEAPTEVLSEPAGEELSPEAQLAYEMMADRRPAEDLPIEELPVVDGAPQRTPEKPKWSKGRIALTVIGILAVLAALIALVAWGSRNKKETPADVGGDEEVVEHSMVDMDEMAKFGPFTYTDESLSEKYNAQTAATVGDYKLSNALLQIFYWSTVYNDLNENADYLSFRGPDVTQPFSDQSYGENVTWEQHYLQTALDYYLQNVALADEATKNGVTVSEQTQEMIDSIPGNLASQASASGFADVNEYLAQSFGPSVTVDDYLDYYRMTSLAYTYAGQIQQGISVTDEEVEDFFDRHAEEYAQQGINKVDQNVINVRHILVMPEQDVDSDGDGTPDQSSDEAWSAAEQSANDIYVEWKLNPTEDNFAAMAADSSSDPGSTENGGLYEGVYPGQMVAEFNDWCFDPERKPGDSAIVRTDYGYHIMYFSGVGDYVYWRHVAESDTQYEKFNKVIDDLFSNYKLKVDYKNLHLFDIVSRSIAQDAANQASGDAETETEAP